MPQKKNNIEVTYSHKYDLMNSLQHLGLASPALNCYSCNNSSNSGLGATVQNNRLTALANNINLFLNRLESKGVDRLFTTLFMKNVKNAVSQNIDPTFKSILQKTVEDYRIEKKKIRLSTGGLGLTGVEMALVGSLMNSGGSSGGGGFSITQAGGQAISQFTAAQNIGGINVGTAGAAIAGDPGSMAALAQSIIPQQLIQNTIGAVFANGFDISCWGASYSPSKAKIDAPLQWDWILTRSGLKQGINVNSINSFLNLAFGVIKGADLMFQNPKLAECTKKGHQFRSQTFNQLVAQTMQTIEQNYRLTAGPVVKGLINVTDLPNWGSVYTVGNLPANEYTYQSYTSVTPINGAGSTNISSGGDSNLADNGQTSVAPKSDNTGLLLGAGAAAVLAKVLFF